MNAKKILIVCFANICRSPAAEAVFHQTAMQLGLSHRLLCESAGSSEVRSGEPADSTARKVAGKKGYDLSKHQARGINKELASRFDYIVAVDTYNLLELREILPASEHSKLSLLLDHTAGHKGRDVPDPYRQSRVIHEHALALIEEGVDGLISHLRMIHKI